jgi:hypothetical protein
VQILRVLALLCLLVGLPAAASLRPAYAPGQVWEYKTRAGDEGSLVKIQKIEPYPEAASQDRVYHVSIIGVRFRNAPLSGTLGHLPVSRETLDASVTRLSESKAEFPDPSEGIAQWRSANGGVFTIPLGQIVDVVEQSFGSNAK